jgi:hypothetical protein
MQEIETRLNQIVRELAVLGPILRGSIKKNKIRKKRKDGSIYVSKPYYTFVYKDINDKEAWKRINSKHLSAVKKMKENGDRYKKLSKEYVCLSNDLGLMSIDKKKEKL